MNTLRMGLCGAAAFFCLHFAEGQGLVTFFNPDFELARKLGAAGAFTPIKASDAFPGWTVTATYVVYDDLSLSGGSVSIIDTNANGLGAGFNFPPIQGKYAALLAGLNGPPFYWGTGPTSIGQTGSIPAAAKSIIFWGEDEGLQITFNGNPLTFFAIGSTTNYTIYGADISAYAGQGGELLFNAPVGAIGEIDNIQFSTQPVALPQLTIGYTNNATIVSWPSAFQNNVSAAWWPGPAGSWTLQTSHDLAAGIWGNYAGPVVNCTVTNPPASGNVFFRLVYP